MQLFDIWQALGTSQIAEVTALVSIALPLILQFRQRNPHIKKEK